MKCLKKEITNRELRDKLTNIDYIERQIHDYSVALGRYIVNGKRYHAELVGSGTLVQIAGKYGILTAQHVIRELLKSETFLISVTSYRHRCEVERNNIDVIELPKPSKRAEIPDLAFVLICGNELTTIQAKKPFWNMSYWKGKIESDHVFSVNSVWIISGNPGVYTETEGPSSRALEAKCFLNELGYTCIKREFTEGEFDYLEAEISYKPETKIPKDFGGFSGGGLWQIPISESQDGSLQASNPILSGVAFSQTKIIENKRGIICHGRNSIYKVLHNIVEQTYSH